MLLPAGHFASPPEGARRILDEFQTHPPEPDPPVRLTTFPRTFPFERDEF
jgi:hypothetical protein